MSRSGDPGWPVIFAVGAVSAATLAYEILLLRVFGYSQWHHFASLAIALALLGFGAAGTALSLLGRRAIQAGDRLFLGGLILGGGGMVLAFLLAQVLHVRPLFAVWDAGEMLKLLVLDFASFIPFFGLALCVGQVFMRWPKSIPRLYAASLLGSGLGSLGASFLLASVFLEEALMLIPCATFLAGAIFGLGQNRRSLLGLGCAGATTLLAGWLLVGLPSLPVSDFKRLSYLLDLPEARVLEKEPGLRDSTTVVRSPSIRIAPALSLRWHESIPSQDALVIGADRVLPLPLPPPVGEDSPRTDHLAATLGALPFELRPRGKVGILGASSWLPMFLAGDRDLDWVEENPDIARPFIERGFLDTDEVETQPARRFLHTGKDTYDLLFFGSATAGGEATAEDYLLTRQGIEAAIDRLSEEGMIAIPLELTNPPRHAPKLMAMIAQELERRGVGKAQGHVAMIRSMQASLVVVTRSPLTAADLELVRAFAERWSFDLAALPGLNESEANRRHRLESPVFFQAGRTLLGDTGHLPPEVAWYSTRVPTDWQPYFWHAMKWSNLPALLDKFGRRGLVWLDWSLLTTATKLVVAGVLASVLILLPLRRLPKGDRGRTRLRIWTYFGALGLGFLLFEMGVFQRVIFFLGHPVPTASLVFAVFLVGSGLGSLGAPQSDARGIDSRVFGPIIGFGVATFTLLYGAGDFLHSMSPAFRFTALGAVLLPLSWSLGRALPWGLRQLDSNRELIPWAWGINGFASVLSAPLAALLSVHASQMGTWVAALVCYGVAWVVALTWTRSEA